MSNLVDIVFEVLKEVGEDQENDNLVKADMNTPLFGRNLDSMGIVYLVAELEDKISEKLNIDITIADERAMSQKTSPFRSVKALVNYAQLLIKEKENN